MSEINTTLKEDIAKISLGGDKKSRDRHVARNKLLPRERINRLLDPGYNLQNFPSK